MAGPNVIYDSGKFSWIFKPGGNYPSTEIHLKWGDQPDTYPNVKTFPAASGTAPVASVLPAGSSGQFYARMVGANDKGESATVMSPEVPFVLSDGTPDGGEITLSIG